MEALLGLNDAHLVGKLLDAMDDDVMVRTGFTAAERERAEALFARLAGQLDNALGNNWHTKEVL